MKSYVENKTAVESLSIHLTQSLISNDQEMIDFCLNNSEDILIKNTIKNLKTPLLAVLLDVLVTRIINYPNRSKNIIKWLKYLLKYNTSFFIGCINLKEKFGNLQTVLLNKTRNLKKLVDLKSKINILRNIGKNNDIGRNCRKKIKNDADQQKEKPLLIIEEGDLEKNEERNDVIPEQQKYVDVSVSDEEGENKIDLEFDKALKAHKGIDLETQEDEDFIDID